MDANRMSLTVGVLALLLAVPLAVIANLLTPLARNWYSTTSQKRMRSRLVEIAHSLGKPETEWPFAPAELALYRAHFNSTRLLSMAIHIWWSLVLTSFYMFRHDIQKPSIVYAGLMILALSGYTYNIVYTIRFVRGARRAVERHSKGGRKKLLDEQQKLQDLLAYKP